MKEDAIKEQSLGLINGLRLAVNVTDSLQPPIIAGAVEKHISATYDAAYAQAIEDAIKVTFVDDVHISCTEKIIAAIEKLKTV